MKRVSLTIVFALCFGFAPSIPLAGDSAGTVIGINTGTAFDNLAFVKLAPLAGGALDRAPCSTNPWSYVFRIDDDIGKATLSLVLTAYTTGEKILIDGANTCAQFETVEDARRVILEK